MKTRDKDIVMETYEHRTIMLSFEGKDYECDCEIKTTCESDWERSEHFGAVAYTKNGDVKRELADMAAYDADGAPVEDERILSALRALAAEELGCE